MSNDGRYPQSGYLGKRVFSELTDLLQNALDEGAGEGEVIKGDLEGLPEGVLGIIGEQRQNLPQVVGGVELVLSKELL